MDKVRSVTQQRLICVLLPRFNMMTLVGLLEPSRIANYLSATPLYAPEYVAADGQIITASNGMTVACQPLPDDIRRGDLVFVFGSWGAEHYANPRVLSWLRRIARVGARIGAVEIASYVLARSGLLDNRRATTHWSYLAGLREKFSDVQAVEQLFTIEGPIMTCAGSTAATDMMLHLIAQDHGDGMVSEISDNIMHYPVRPGTAPQRQSLGRGLEPLADGVRDAIDLVEGNISEPLSVPEISAQVGISQRQLERLFKQSIGCSIVQFGLLVRLQHARVLLISTDLGVREISAASGFNSLSHFAFAFRKCFGRRPSDYRQSWPDEEVAPSWPGTLATYLETLSVRPPRAMR